MSVMRFICPLPVHRSAGAVFSKPSSFLGVQGFICGSSFDRELARVCMATVHLSPR
jgi:hypothetical protein